MHITPVASSTLATIAYDASEQILQLEFRDRSVYDYLGVPAEVHRALLSSPSKGQFFNRAIRGIFLHELAPAQGVFLILALMGDSPALNFAATSQN